MNSIHDRRLPASRAERVLRRSREDQIMSGIADQFEGGCLCGAVRFVATGQPGSVSWCNCQSCRRHSGAPVSVFAAFKRTACVVTKGEITKFNSSPGMLRGFCARCGSTLTCEGEPRRPLKRISMSAPSIKPRDFSKVGWVERARNPSARSGAPRRRDRLPNLGNKDEAALSGDMRSTASPAPLQRAGVDRGCSGRNRIAAAEEEVAPIICHRRRLSGVVQWVSPRPTHPSAY
jgi:hypothetical protein